MYFEPVVLAFRTLMTLHYCDNISIFMSFPPIRSKFVFLFAQSSTYSSHI